MTSWLNKNVTVFGLGKSGLAIAKKLVDLGSKVFLTEAISEDKVDSEARKKLAAIGVGLEVGGHSGRCLEKAELIVLSPGVNPKIPILEEARNRNIQIISEIELAFRFFHKPIIAITGTNGKTTTTTLIGEFLKAAGRRVAVAGNIGTPLISIDDADLDFIVAEVSSYQLETVVSFRPWISLILNLTEDHISRHGSMESYGSAKANVFSNQRKTDYLIYNADDLLVSRLVEPSEARRVPFSKKHAQEFFPLPISDIKIKGEHNIENAMAATAAAKIAGVSGEIINKVLRAFPGVPHRIEFVAEKNGIRFYNDSKATNPDSTIVALKTLGNEAKNIVLIMGGRDKGGDLTSMIDYVRKTVKKVVLIGEAAPRFAEALKNAGFSQIETAEDFLSAVKLSYELAEPHGIVLLSPACASFDMFRDFEDRGDQFKSLVERL